MSLEENRYGPASEVELLAEGARTIDVIGDMIAGQLRGTAVRAAVFLVEIDGEMILCAGGHAEDCIRMAGTFIRLANEAKPDDGAPL